MCRMVGVVFRREVPMGTLVDLRHVSEIGKIPGQATLGHRDGWGIVSFANGSPTYIGRSSRWAYQDPSFDAALKEVTKITPPNILIAHVRALSVGQASLPNTHPFVMDGLVLAHNGTVEGFKPMTNHKPKGATDSELLLARLADLMDEKKDLRASLKSLVVDDLLRLEFSAAILLVSDGNRLYGYRDYSPGKSSEYYDLRISKGDDCVVFFQESTVKHDAELPRLKKGELVMVDKDLNIEREMLR
jgi:predicted glutamine amidotransferase